MANDVFNPTFTEDVYFGEIVILDGYQAIMTYDVDGVKGWQRYEAENPAHQTALATPKANGRKRSLSIVYHVQHFPIGVNFETWVNEWVDWGNEWKGFKNSIAKLHDLNPKDRNDWYSLNAEVAKLRQQGNFFKYKTPTVRTYQKDGETKSVRGLEVIEQYASQNECQKAYETNLDGVLAESASSMKEEPKPIELDRQTALNFVMALANQIDDAENAWLLLGEKFKELNMTALSIDDKDVRELAEKANPTVFNTAF